MELLEQFPFCFVCGCLTDDKGIGVVLQPEAIPTKPHACLCKSCANKHDATMKAYAPKYVELIKTALINTFI